MANRIESKLVKGPYRGTIRTMIEIAREEGIRQLHPGISAALIRQVFSSGIRMVTYQIIRDYIFKKQPGEHFALWKAAFSGICAGVVAQGLANPAELVKVHLQMEGKRKMMGLPTRMTGLADAYSQVCSTSGVMGFWKGAFPNVCRAALVTIGDVAAYDYIKRYLLMNTSFEDNTKTHTICSLSAGFCSAVLGCPADVVKARVMYQPVDEYGRGLLYKSTLHCAYQAVRYEGFLSLYKGFVPMWVRLGPWALVFWLSYEQMMKLIGTSYM